MNYRLQYYAAWAVFILGALCGGIVSASALGIRPSWMTQDVVATAAMLAPVLVLIGAALPQIQRTPGTREQKYLEASVGLLPKDIAEKHPEVVSTVPPPITPLPKE